MKLYISADIEGVSGISHWDETDYNKEEYKRFKKQMQMEVNAVCDSALSSGAKEIWIKDSHETARNIDISLLPENTTLISSKSGHPFRMMQELDVSFDAVLFVGYHSGALSSESPLAHTFTREMSYLKINDKFASEFLVNALIATYLNVPVIFISGDEGICSEAKIFNPNISTVSTIRGNGSSSICRHPQTVIENIKSNVTKIIKEGNFKKCNTKLPEKFKIEIGFANHPKAYKASFYPNVEKISSNTIGYNTNDYFEFLRMLSFVI